MADLHVLELAGSALFQDAGRGHVDSGVPVSGAFDRPAHAAATALVGEDASQACLEVVGMIHVQCDVPITCAVTGRGTMTVDGRPAGAWTALDVPAGSRVEVRAEGRAYLAVTGGFQPEPVLGSRSTCLLGPIGPAPVRVGDLLPLVSACTSATAGDFVRPAQPRAAVRIVAGPHLRVTTCEVQVLDVSRIGVRLTAGLLEDPQAAAASADLPSLGVLPGTVQVLPSGDWMLLGPDAGTMGGYPVAGVVASADLGMWAHALVGDVVRLEVVDADMCPDPSTPVIIHVSGLGG
jgi:allophanate hydrolase subunit 2